MRKFKKVSVKLISRFDATASVKSEFVSNPSMILKTKKDTRRCLFCFGADGGIFFSAIEQSTGLFSRFDATASVKSEFVSNPSMILKTKKDTRRCLFCFGADGGI